MTVIIRLQCTVNNLLGAVDFTGVTFLAMRVSRSNDSFVAGIGFLTVHRGTSTDRVFDNSSQLMTHYITKLSCSTTTGCWSIRYAPKLHHTVTIISYTSKTTLAISSKASSNLAYHHLSLTYIYICLSVKGKKYGKAEHLYSSLHGIQTTLKRLGMDHTV